MIPDEKRKAIMKEIEFEEKMRKVLRDWIKTLTPAEREKVRHDPDLLEGAFQKAMAKAYKEFIGKE